MATFNAAGISFKPINEAFQPGGVITSDGYYAIDPIGEPPREGPPEYEEVEVSFPGVDGVATKRLGFRGRSIWATLVFVGTDKADVQTLVETATTAFAVQARYEVKLPGGSARPGCKLARGQAIQTHWAKFDTHIYCVMEVHFRQLSLAN